jgi:hypothetical protein
MVSRLSVFEQVPLKEIQNILKQGAQRKANPAAGAAKGKMKVKRNTKAPSVLTAR